MKHGKKPSVKQCKFLSDRGYNPNEWFICKDTPILCAIVHRKKNIEEVLYK